MDDNLLELLNNRSYLSKVIEERLFRNYTNIYDLDRLESFIINNINDKKYTGIIKQYTSFIYNEFKDNKYIIFDSKIFDNEKIYRFFSKKQLKEINGFKKKLIDEYTHFINSIKKGTCIDEKYLRLVISLIGKETVLTDKTYRYLINNINSNNSILVGEFIVKYSAYLASKELNVPDKDVYYTSYNFVNKCPLTFTSGEYNPNKDYVFINIRKLTKENFIELIQAVGHEMKHRKQYQSVKNKRINLTSFYWFINKLFCKHDDFILNYFNSETELDAEYYGWSLVCKVLSKYSNNKRYLRKANKNRLLEKINIVANFKHIERYENVLEDITYNVKLLDKIIKEDPSVINDYETLKYIYNEDGTRKDFVSLLNTEYSLTNHKDIKDIFRIFYLEDINSGKAIIINNLDYTSKKRVINRLIDLGLYEISELNNIINICNESKERSIYKVNSKVNRIIKRIGSIVYMLNLNYNVINEINSNLINAKLNKLLILIDEVKLKTHNGIYTNLICARNIHTMQQSGCKLQKVLK